MPIERVAARIGDIINKTTIDAIMIVRALTRIETLVLKVSCTTEVSELSRETRTPVLLESKKLMSFLMMLA